jgi:hypothetical protein
MTTNGKKLIGEAIEFNIIDQGGTMSTLEVVAIRWPIQVEERKTRPKSLLMLVVWILV